MAGTRRANWAEVGLVERLDMDGVKPLAELSREWPGVLVAEVGLSSAGSDFESMVASLGAHGYSQSRAGAADVISNRRSPVLWRMRMLSLSTC